MTTTDEVRSDDSTETEPEEGRLQLVVRSLMVAAMKIPGFRVNRDDFLRNQLGSFTFEEGITVEAAIHNSPIEAGVPMQLLDERADAIGRKHLVAASGVSALTGIPGGLLMAATIPADLAQFYWHSLVCAQELAYLYGWPDLFPDGELELDEETEARLILLLGALHGIEVVNKGMSFTAAQLGKSAAKYLPRTGLASSWYYPLIKSVASQVGITVTRQSFGRSVAKVIPIVGAVASGGVTAYTFRQMTKNLKEHLRNAALGETIDLASASEAPESAE